MEVNKCNLIGINFTNPMMMLWGLVKFIYLYSLSMDWSKLTIMFCMFACLVIIEFEFLMLIDYHDIMGYMLCGIYIRYSETLCVFKIVWYPLCKGPNNQLSWVHTISEVVKFLMQYISVWVYKCFMFCLMQMLMILIFTWDRYLPSVQYCWSILGK